MGTRVRLIRSGGLAGISMVADVDLEQLPGATADEVRAALAEIDFDAPAAPAARRGAADAYQYDLEVTDGGTRRMTAHDPFVGPGVRALLDVLMPLAEPE
ncbi:MAG: protealysin inhibitor emfourin [Acidimicrobiales bacterium]